MSDSPKDGPVFVPVADVEVDVVRHLPQGFTLAGRGADGADYQLEMHLDLPLDPKTRAVLGELFSQSEWKIGRRVRPSVRSRRDSARAVTTAKAPDSV